MSEPPRRLLLVDDEPQLVRVLAPALTAAGFEVEVARTGEEALTGMARVDCDVVLLDLGLPDMDGKTVIERARVWSQTPIIVLSARDMEAEKVAALDLGADDFVNKPFAIGELLARVRAAIRGRERRFLSTGRLRTGDLDIDFELRRVTVLGQEVKLTPREYELLAALARFCGRVLTHRQLMTAVWGEGAVSDPQFVRVLVGQVRQKIEEDAGAPKLLLTEPGTGYRLTDTPPSDAHNGGINDDRAGPA
jgi:two-component system KDP operon response regulator KdpE